MLRPQTPEHPDPLGEQLVSLAAAIERAEVKGEHQQWERMPLMELNMASAKA